MTKDTTATPAGRERYQESPLSGRQPMSAPDLDAIQARLDAYIDADTPKEFTDSTAALRRHAPADLAALLAEVKRLTAEREGFRQAAVSIRDQRDEARADLAALRGDVEALADEGGRSNRHWNGYAVVTVADLAAVLANHPTTNEADRD